MEWFHSICPELYNANLWDIVPAVLGAFVGAAAAAIPAFFLARKASLQTLERDRISRIEQQKSQTLSGLAKLMHIVNGIENIHHDIESTITAAEKAGHADMQLWQIITPTIGFESKELSFEANEIAMFITANNPDYFTELHLLAARYNTLKIALREYASRRTKLTDQLSAEMEGQVGTTILTREQQMRLAPRVAELETLANQLRTLAKEYCVVAFDLATKFGPIAREYFKDETFPVLSTGKRED